MRINDIYLAYASWGKAGKQRPILIVDYDDQTLSFYAITSKYHHKSKAMQAIRYPLVDWQGEGLAKQSYVVIDPKYQMLRFGSHFTRLSSLYNIRLYNLNLLFFSGMNKLNLIQFLCKINS